MGKAFGISTVIIDNEPFEIAQMRIDGDYSDGRRPNSVQHVTDIAQDLARRDFTMNAIAEDDDGNLVDPYGGAIDISNRLIKFVGNPDDRILEDALRILRAFRFKSQLGFNIEEMSLYAIEQYFKVGNDFRGVSQERITAEMEKLLLGQDAFDTIKLMAETDALWVVFPALKDTLVPHKCKYHLETMAPWGNSIFAHIMYVLKFVSERSIDLSNEERLIVRLAALFHDIGKPASRIEREDSDSFTDHDRKGAEMTSQILTRMRFSTDIVKSVTDLVKRHMTFHNLIRIVKDAKARMILGRPNVHLQTMLGIADTLGTTGEGGIIPNVREVKILLDSIDKFKNKYPVMLPDPIVDGKDLIEAGLKPGPDFKERLKRVYNAQLSGENRKERLIKQAINLTL
jgi:poly(A) polymerase/tRNA nucleotidyltransferase (CCA-adding enzyme)